MNFREDFKGKRVMVMGLGLLGRGVGDAEFLLKNGAEVLVTDKKTEEELKESVEYLKEYSNVSFRLGEHRTEDFTNADCVIKAAGVPLESPYIKAAKEAGVPVYMSTALFARYAREIGATIVGVTGTRGKSTVAHLLCEILKKTALRHSSGHPKRQIFLGGNIRGVSTLAMLPKVKRGDIVVLELDSWQLQGFGDIKISPNIAVFTNFMPDHLNYYGDLGRYFNDKANIFRFQQKGDSLISGAGVNERILKEDPPVPPIVPQPLTEDITLKVPGEHNRGNASLAAEALRILGLSGEKIQKGLESFGGIEGRLELLKETNGVKIYNDNNATTPEATIAALKALGENIVLIMGGADKGLIMDGLVGEIGKRCAGVILLSGTGTERIKEKLLEAPVCESLESALLEALRVRGGGMRGKGGIILFSPAFASFGMFKNEYDRGDRFKELVSKI